MTLSLSLNEVEATAKKAARGAGYPWGLAEEAGKAVRWLCAHDIDGCAALAGLLEVVDGAEIADRSPLVGQATWAAPGSILCPLAAGAAASDRANLADFNELKLRNVVQPILLLPFAAMLAIQMKCNVTLLLDGTQITTDGKATSRSVEAPEHAAWVTLLTDGEIGSPARHCQRANPAPSAWDKLNVFAHRTYAPATEESRMKGAGAGTSDND